MTEIAVKSIIFALGCATGAALGLAAVAATTPAPAPRVALDPPAATAPALPARRAATEPLRRTPTDAEREEIRCLSELLYYEARGESAKGLIAVVNVVENRVARRWRGADSICDVARFRVERGGRTIYQFEGMEHEGEAKTDRIGWIRSETVAEIAVLDRRWRSITDADHYWGRAKDGTHACEHEPKWFDPERMVLGECIGGHRFARHL